MKILLDTNRYTDLARGNADVQRVVDKADEVWIPIIVLGELRAGFRQGTRQTDNEAALEKFPGRTGGEGVVTR